MANAILSRTIFLTGGSGFIGSNLICSLIKQGYRIISILPPEENLNYYLLNNPEVYMKIVIADLATIGEEYWDVMFVKGDIRDRSFLMQLFYICREKGYNFMYIIHLAACSTIQKAVKNEDYAWQVNVQGTKNILDAIDIYCKNSEGGYCINGFIYSSTDKVYGEGSEKPYEEEHIISPCFPYEKSKAAADILVREAYNKLKLPAIVVRFCNVYGPKDMHSSRLIPGTLFNLLYCHKPPLLKMYKDSKSELYSFKRDLIYIDDIINGIMLLLNKLQQYSELPHLQKNIPIYGEAFNLGTEHCYIVKDVIEMIQALVGDTTAPELETVQCGEILEQSMSYHKAKMILEFQPKTTLEEGLKKTVQWYQKGEIDYDWFE